VSQPTTRYALSGDVRIAYQVSGNGPLDLIFVPGFISNLDVQWEDPGFRRLMTRLGAFSRLVMFDKRGTGLSDRVDTGQLPSLEKRMEDVRAVMDAVGSTRAAVLGASEGAPMAVLFAATYPERTRALVLYGAYAHFHSWVLRRDAVEQFVEDIEKGWGTGATAARFAPDQDERFRSWWGRYERLSASPTAAIALARMNASIDVRPVLSAIRVPTLIIHRSKDVRVNISGGRYLAEKIARARFVEMPGRDHPIWTGDVDGIVDEIEEFLTGARQPPDHARVLATLLVTRLVDAVRTAAQLGDRIWSERVRALRDASDSIIAQHGGQIVGSNAEGTCARFDGPARAIRCAVALREAARQNGLTYAAGVHTGEIELAGEFASGLSLLVTQRIAATAAAGQILVSSTVSDLVAGSGLHFSEHGKLSMEGVSTEWRLLAVVTEQHLEPAGKTPAKENLDILSEREQDVLVLVAEGLSNPAIATRLKLSEHTVKRHVANILLKLDLPTRAAAAALVGRGQFRRGL
jgi:pimeloyl-ACP methyl ester carboxylesterase/DNA-binding CsgD family transcriptional regulator